MHGEYPGLLHILLPITVESRSKCSRLGNLLGDGCDPNCSESHILDIVKLKRVKPAHYYKKVIDILGL